MIARALVKENHNVGVIDTDSDALLKLDDTDVLQFLGSGVSMTTLAEAEVKNADILIATTKSDEINMICCFLAKGLGVRYTVARVRDPEYLSSTAFLTREMKIDFVANPERATAREISRMLRLPFAVSIETFAKGLVEMVEMRVDGDEPFIGIPLNQLYSIKKQMPHVLFCGVKRGNDAFIPKGNSMIHEGDSLFVTADYATMTAFFRYIGKNTKAPKDAMIIGGSRIAFYLADILSESGMKTKIIEQDEDKARRIAESLKDSVVLQGDGTDQELLLSEGLKTCESFIALTDRDEENLMAGLYAAKEGCGKVIVKSNRTNYTEMLTAMGMNGIISPSQIARNIILRAVRARVAGGGSIERMYSIMEGQAEALEFIAKGNADYLGIPLSKLTIDKDSLIAVIVRNNKASVPFGADTIEEGDHVVVITKQKGISSLSDVVRYDS